LISGGKRYRSPQLLILDLKIAAACCTPQQNSYHYSKKVSLSMPGEEF